MTTEDNTAIDDLDAPVSEALLMGEDPDDVKERIPAEVDEDAAKIADENAEGKPTKEAEEKTVPQARFNQVYAEKKALEEHIRALEEASKPTEVRTQVDVKALRKEATGALMDGDVDKYEELQSQIDDEIQRRAEDRAVQHVGAIRERESFVALAERLTEKYPVLNPEGGDARAISLVVDLREAYVAKGMSMSAALEAAVEKIVPHFANAGGTAPAKSDNVDARNVHAIRRGAEDSNKMPPSGVGVGNRAMEPTDTADISQDKWEKMSQAEREKILAA